MHPLTSAGRWLTSGSDGGSKAELDLPPPYYSLMLGGKRRLNFGGPAAADAFSAPSRAPAAFGAPVPEARGGCSGLPDTAAAMAASDCFTKRD